MWYFHVIVCVFARFFFWSEHLFFFVLYYHNIFPSDLMTYSTPAFDMLWNNISKSNEILYLEKMFETFLKCCKFWTKMNKKNSWKKFGRKEGRKRDRNNFEVEMIMLRVNLYLLYWLVYIEPKVNTTKVFHTPMSNETEFKFTPLPL